MSEADLVAYRRKVVLASVAVVAALAAVSSVLLVECFADGACGVGYVKGSGGGVISHTFGGGGDGVTIDLGEGGAGVGSGGPFSDSSSAAIYGDGQFFVRGGGGSIHGDLYEESASVSTPAAVDDGAADEESIAMSAVAAIAAAVPSEADAVAVDSAAKNGTGHHHHRRDCNTEWCYSRSLMGLWEWLLLLVEAGFCIALRHDLAPATAGVGVESFVL